MAVGERSAVPVAFDRRPAPAAVTRVTRNGDGFHAGSNARRGRRRRRVRGRHVSLGSRAVMSVPVIRPPGTPPIRYTLSPPKGRRSIPATACRSRCRRTAARSSMSSVKADGTETAVASIAVFTARTTHSGHRRGEHAVLVARQPVDRVLRRKQLEEGSCFKRPHASRRQRTCRRGAARRGMPMT